MTKPPETDRLRKYRDRVSNVFVANMLAIHGDEQFTVAERAGTAMLALSAAVGAAAGLWVEANDHLKNAPVDVAINDMMQLLLPILTERRTAKLHVIDGGAA